MSGTPPRLAAWLLHRLLDDAARDVLAGDLEEEYRRDRARDGAIKAGASYWIYAARTVIACRITARRRTGAHRMDFDPGRLISAGDLIKPALRQFKEQPLYTLACAGTLAFAVAAACASFAVMRRALLDPLPYRNDDELVSILTMVDGATSAVSPHVLQDLRGAAAPVQGTAPVVPMGIAYQTAEGLQTATANRVSREYFEVLGVWPAIGRAFADHERETVVVSWRFFERVLAASDRAIGTPIAIDGRSLTVVGVMPKAFVPPYFATADFWLPLDMTPLLADIRPRRTLTVLARRATGISQESLEQFLASFSGDMQRRFPEHRGQSWVARRVRDELVGPARPALVGTVAAALALLLIVCANIAGLSAAQAAAARRHIAIRAALGATRGRLFLEQFTDSIVVAALGSVAGVGLAYGLVAVAAEYQSQFLARLAPVSLDATTACAGMAAGLAVGAIAAIIPRCVVSAVCPLDSTRARGSDGDARVSMFRSALVVVQVAIALVLVVGAGLLIRTVNHLATTSLGFASEGLTTVNVNLPGPRYRTQEAQVQFERQVLEQVRQIPGLNSVSASVGIPIVGQTQAALTLRGDTADRPRDEIAYFSVSPEFMSSIGARLVAGRDLEPTDHAKAPRVVLVNETMARTYFPGGDALGSQVQIGGGAPTDPWITIIGIVADLRQHGPTEAIRPTAFGSTYQYSWPRRYFTVRTEGTPPISLAMDLRSAIGAVDPALAVGAVRPIVELVSERTARHTLVMMTLAVFGVIACALCAVGLYAVVALTSRLRRREYAIRIALGSAPGDVRWMVIRQALVLGAIGTVTGVAAAAGLTQFIQGLLHGVTPLDAATFTTAAACLLMMAVAAAWQPARYAERADPVDTMKTE
jgi:putative ABC transport system permease protein